MTKWRRPFNLLIELQILRDGPSFNPKYFIIMSEVRGIKPSHQFPVENKCASIRWRGETCLLTAAFSRCRLCRPFISVMESWKGSWRERRKRPVIAVMRCHVSLYLSLSFNGSRQLVAGRKRRKDESRRSTIQLNLLFCAPTFCAFRNWWGVRGPCCLVITEGEQHFNLVPRGL